MTEQLNFTYPRQQSTFKTHFSSSTAGFSSALIYRTETSAGYNVSAVPRHLIGLHLNAPVTIAHWRSERKHYYRFRPGDIVFTPMGSPVHYAHADVVDALYIELSPEAVNEVAVQSGIDPHHITLIDNFGTRDVVLAQLGHSLLAEIQTQGLGSRLMFETLTAQIVVHLLRHYTQIREPGKPIEREDADVLRVRLRPVIEYIQTHYSENLSLKQLADIVYLTPSHFSRLFKQAFALSPYQFVIQQRVNAACKLLKDPSLTVAEVALQVGFADHSHLTRHYKRVTGSNPRD